MENASLMSIDWLLGEFLRSFLEKGCSPLNGILQIEVQPENQRWHVDFQRGEGWLQGSSEQAFLVVITSSETLRQLYAGDLSPMTAIGREHYSDPAPLDIRPGKGVELIPGSPLFQELLGFVQRFFSRFQPEKIEMGFKHARTIHGGSVVGLFYGLGFRSAWYGLRKGERLNNPDDTNPFPQAFVFLAGSGMAQLGEITCAVRAGEVYHIPPGSVHMVWNENEQPLELLFLAWGDQA